GASGLVDVEAVPAQDPAPLLAQAVVGGPARRDVLDDVLQHVAEDSGQPPSTATSSRSRVTRYRRIRSRRTLSSFSRGCGGPRLTPPIVEQRIDLAHGRAGQLR